MFIETTGYLRLSSYYICCLLVLPSHVMGMSRFVSAEDLSGAKTLEENNVLRHFVYTYYCGLLKVDTYHIRDANGGAEAFRLVEYFDTWWFCTYAIMVPFYALFGPLLLVFSLPFYFFLRLVACLNRISEECLSQKNQVFIHSNSGPVDLRLKQRHRSCKRAVAEADHERSWGPDAPLADPLAADDGICETQNTARCSEISPASSSPLANERIVNFT